MAQQQMSVEEAKAQGLYLTPDQVSRIKVLRGGPEADARHDAEVARVMGLIREGKVGPRSKTGKMG